MKAVKKPSVASSAGSKAFTVAFHRAIEKDAGIMEQSLVVLRRALLAVSMTVIAASIVLLVVGNEQFAVAAYSADSLRHEGSQASMHSVRGVGCDQS